MQRYDEYKDSGVEWIGEIPEDWEIKKLKYIGKSIIGLTYSPEEVIPADGILVLRSSNIQDSKLSLKDCVYVDKIIPQKLVVRKGDILICSRNGSRALIGKNITIDEELEGNTFGAFMTVFRTNYYEFVSKYFNSQVFNGQSGLFLTSTVNQLTIHTLNNFYIALPPKDEQITIANYLNKKTTEIDTLITQKEALLALYEEEKAAIINQAVTKGVDLDVMMKESGVPWLGEIPKHWEMKKFRFVFNLTKGLTITKANLKDSGIPCVNYGEIHSKYGFEVIPEEDLLKCVDKNYLETSSQSLLNRGDFVFADTSEDIEGSGNFTHLHSDTNIFAGYHTIISRLKMDADYRYIAYFLDSLSFRNQVRQQVKGVKVYSITNAILKDTFILLPSKEKQHHIVDFIENELSRINSKIQKTKKIIALQKEYRTALISEVVTGKIKVSEEM